MNRALLRHTWRVQRAKLAIVSIALAAWGFLLAVVYARFGSQFTALMQSGMLPEQFARFGGGDVFSLAGSIALGLIHPIAISLTSVFAVGFSSAAVAGERQRGTLEVALARPLSRRVLYLSLLAASFGFIAVSDRGAARGQHQRSGLCGRCPGTGVQAPAAPVAEQRPACLAPSLRLRSRHRSRSTGSRRRSA
jgi:hypothetical protein